MAFVNDGHDPSGLGMFSKAGRFTSEKYIIFQRKEEILYNKKRVLKVSSFPSLGTEQHKLNEFAGKNIEAQEKKRLMELERLDLLREENQPFYKQVSRERMNQIKSIKNPPKPVGYYHPRYTVLDKSPQKVWNILEVHKKELPKKEFIKDLPTEDELYTPMISRQQSHVKGHIELGRSQGRGEHMVNQKNNPHEKRFETIHFSSTWSNMHRQPSFNMRKTMGREDNKIYENKEFAPDYQPNFEFGKRGLGSCGPPLHKIPSRKPFNKQMLTQNENFFDYDQYKTHSSIFKKQTKREG